LRKCFAHSYPGVPQWLIQAEYNADDDPVYAYLPYFEDVYKDKPFQDALKTLYAGAVINSVMPMVQRVMEPGASPLLPDGAPVTDQRDNALASTMPAGQKLEPMYIQVPATIGQMYEQFAQEMRENEPGTGEADLSATTAPWTGRMATTQANAGPKSLVQLQADEFTHWGQFVVDWTAAHPGERMVAYGRMDDGAIDKSKVIVVESEQLKGMTVTANINSVSTIEAISTAEHMRGFVQAGFAMEEDLQEAMGRTNVSDYMLKKRTDQIIRPYIDGMIQRKAAELMGPGFLLGPDGTPLNSQGQTVDPVQALQSQGVHFPQREQPPTGTVGPGGMPGLPTLSAPGTTPLQGLPG
jgi:hypothetical protein